MSLWVVASEGFLHKSQHLNRKRAFWSVFTGSLAGMNRFAVLLDAQPKEKNKQMGQVQECPEVATGLDLDFLYTNHPAKTIQPAIENRIDHPPTL